MSGRGRAAGIGTAMTGQRPPRRITVVRRGDDLVIQPEAGKRAFGLTPAEAVDVIGQLVRLLTPTELERFAPYLAGAARRS